MAIGTEEAGCLQAGFEQLTLPKLGGLSELFFYMFLFVFLGEMGGIQTMTQPQPAWICVRNWKEWKYLPWLPHLVDPKGADI